MSAAALNLIITSNALAVGETTLDRTICDSDGDYRLEYCDADRSVAWDSIDSQRGNGRHIDSMIFFGHMADFQVADSEAPSLVHMFWADPFVPAADRPQQEVAAQIVDSMARQLNEVRSPFDDSKLDLVMLGGDSADSALKNETETVIDTLDGGAVKTDSGRMGLQYPCSWPWLDRGSSYTGVYGSSILWDPYSSAPGSDGPGYSPDPERNMREAGTDNSVPDIPGFFDAANRSFQAEGLKMPWYALNGNHDELVAGNFSAYVGELGKKLAEISTGCLSIMPKDMGQKKVRKLVRDIQRYRRNPSSNSIGRALLKKLKRAFNEESNPYDLTVIPDDPERKILSKQELIDEYFETTTEPRGHGFGWIPSDLREAGTAYYTFSPKPDVRFIALDTINPCGLWNGAVGDAQFKQLESDLTQAKQTGQITVVFGHHTLDTINNAWSCDSQRDEVYHFGLKRMTGGKTRAHRGKSLEQLFLEQSNVIYISGHEHLTDIRTYESRGGRRQFIELVTPSHIDSPQQSRTVEIFNNRDCSISVNTTIVDHVAEPDVGDSYDLNDPTTLASLGRRLAFNDPQINKSAAGGPEDRNALLTMRMDRIACSNFRRLQLKQRLEDRRDSVSEEVPSSEKGRKPKKRKDDSGRLLEARRRR